jgi:hypothetical protein
LIVSIAWWGNWTSPLKSRCPCWLTFSTIWSAAICSPSSIGRADPATGSRMLWS